MRTLIKVVVGLVAMGALGALLVRSARNTQAEPYEVPRDRLARWTLSIDLESSGSGVALALRPPPEFAPTLLSRVFARSGESLNSPNPAEMPLVLRTELDSTVSGTITPEALLALARASGLESTTFEPRCMAHRRVSQPGLTRQVFFMRFESPAFNLFRRQLLQRLRDAGRATSFDPAALSPVIIIAATDAAFSRWLPLRLEAVDDCLAPVTVH